MYDLYLFSLDWHLFCTCDGRSSLKQPCGTLKRNVLKNGFGCKLTNTTDTRINAIYICFSSVIEALCSND